MGLFDSEEKDGSSHHKRSGKRKLEEWLVIGVLVLFCMQVFGWLIETIFGKGIYLGPGFLLLAAAASVLLALGFAANMIRRQPIDKRDVITMFVVFAVTILAFMYLRELLPEAFQPSAMAVKAFAQSMIAIP